MVSENSTASAAYAVFGTAKLLETILLLLPMKDILLDDRVCKEWRDAIASSKKLQKALFFLPEPPGSHFSIEWERINYHIYDTKLVTELANDTLSQDQLARPQINSYILASRATETFSIAVENPLFFDRPRTSKGEHPTVCGLIMGCWPKSHSGVKIYPKFDYVALYKNVQPSWKRMYLTQPPARNLCFMNGGACVPPGWASASIMVKNEKGITMGDVVDATFRPTHAITGDPKIREGAHTPAPEKKNKRFIKSQVKTANNKAAAEVSQGSRIRHFDFRYPNTFFSFKGLRIANNKEDAAEFSAFATFTQKAEDNKDVQLIRAIRGGYVPTEEENRALYALTACDGQRPYASFNARTLSCFKILLREWEESKGNDA